jgi:hypothetical protein
MFGGRSFGNSTSGGSRLGGTSSLGSRGLSGSRFGNVSLMGNRGNSGSLLNSFERNGSGFGRGFGGFNRGFGWRGGGCFGCGFGWGFGFGWGLGWGFGWGWNPWFVNPWWGWGGYWGPAAYYNPWWGWPSYPPVIINNDSNYSTPPPAYGSWGNSDDNNYNGSPNTSAFPDMDTQLGTGTFASSRYTLAGPSLQF